MEKQSLTSIKAEIYAIKMKQLAELYRLRSEAESQLEFINKVCNPSDLINAEIAFLQKIISLYNANISKLTKYRRMGGPAI